MNKFTEGDFSICFARQICTTHTHTHHMWYFKLKCSQIIFFEKWLMLRFMTFILTLCVHKPFQFKENNFNSQIYTLFVPFMYGTYAVHYCYDRINVMHTHTILNFTCGNVFTGLHLEKFQTKWRAPLTFYPSKRFLTLIIKSEFVFLKICEKEYEIWFM